MAAVAVFFLLLITLTSTTTIHARESQFFAKVSNTPKDSLPNVNNNNNPQNTNQPTFVPQSQDSGFGLYGHESGQLPPSDTTTITTSRLPANLPENYNPVAYTTPIHSNTQDLPNEYSYEPQAYNGETKLYSSQNQQEFMGTNNNGENNMYNSQKQEVGTNNINGGDMYNYEQQGMSDTRLMDNGKYYYAPENAYKSKNFDDTRFMETENGGNTYSVPKQGENEMYSPQQNQEMVGQQGMSDTRFLENGKYYYDLQFERMNANSKMNSRGVRNGFETQGYYGDNQNPQGYYENSQNSYDRYNTNGGGYQFNP